MALITVAIAAPTVRLTGIGILSTIRNEYAVTLPGERRPRYVRAFNESEAVWRARHEAGEC